MPDQFVRQRSGARVGAALAIAGLTAWQLITASPAVAADPAIIATVTYTGHMGPVNGSHPLCLCVYSDANLQERLGCLISGQNGAVFQIGALAPIDYFFIAFLDPNFDEVVNPTEPFAIYRDRTTPPADPVTAAIDAPSIDITFGDESLTPTPLPSSTPTGTPTPTETPSRTPTPTPTETPPPTEILPTAATPTPTLTPTAVSCAGDCDGSGEVTINELLVLVNVALGDAPLQACAGADTDGSGAIEITEILAAVNHALLGCAPALSNG